jgi:hypothetical protein
MEDSTRTLNMKFETGDGKTRVVSMANARAIADIDADDLKDAMDAMIAKGVFTYDLSAKLGATVVERTAGVIF